MSESPPVDDVAQLIDDDDGDDAGAALSSGAIAAQVRHHLVELITCVSTRAALEELRDEGVTGETLESTQKRLWDSERRKHLDRVTKFARDVRRHLHEIKQRLLEAREAQSASDAQQRARHAARTASMLQAQRLRGLQQRHAQQASQLERALAASGATKPEIRTRLKQFELEARREVQALQMEFAAETSQQSESDGVGSEPSDQRQPSRSHSAASTKSQSKQHTSASTSRSEHEPAFDSIEDLNSTLQRIWRTASNKEKKPLVQAALSLHLFGSPKNRHLPLGRVDRAALEEACSLLSTPPPPPPSYAPSLSTVASTTQLGGSAAAAAAGPVPSAGSATGGLEAPSLSRRSSVSSDAAAVAAAAAAAEKTQFSYESPLRADRAARNDEFMEHYRKLLDLQHASMRYERNQALKAQGL